MKVGHNGWALLGVIGYLGSNGSCFDLICTTKGLGLEDREMVNTGNQVV